jgi:hypothetical protein
MIGLKPLLALAYGAIVGFIGVVLHNAWSPFGLIFALLETFTGLWLAGRYWGKRRFTFLASVGWIALVWRAASHGVSYELLIVGNTNGELFFYGGLVTALLALAVKP